MQRAAKREQYQSAQVVLIQPVHEGKRRMESLVARAGWWLVALLAALLMFVNALDAPFAVHMAIFALAAIAGLVTNLRTSDYKLAAVGLKPAINQSRYDDDLIRAGVILTTFWSAPGF